MVRDLRGVCEELSTLRLDTADVVPNLLPLIRRELATDNVILYRVGEAVEGWRMTSWVQDGNAEPLRRVVAALLETGTPMAYRPSKVSAAQRNRVVDAVTVLGSKVWQATTTCREMFRPLGMASARHLRVLLCDGPNLLAWFGTVHTGRLTRHHVRALSTLAPVLRRRLIAQHRLEAAPTAFAAIDAALARIGAPAYVIGPKAVIHAMNAAGSDLLARRGTEVRAALVCDSTALRFDRTALASRGVPRSWLAVLREDPTRRLDVAVAVVAQRWQLSARQCAVLAMLLRGYTNAVIAAELAITVRAVELHVTKLFDRAGVENRAALIATVLAPSR